jgi:hypothetical protein
MQLNRDLSLFSKCKLLVTAVKVSKATSEEKHSGEPGQCDSNSCDFLEQSLTLCRQELSGRGSNADF